MKYKPSIILIFLLSLAFRLWQLNWDNNNHLHPDERMIVMVSERISLKELNPKFFAYGSFPIYLLHFISSLLSASYDSATLYGRAISAIFDSFTVILVIRLCYLLFKSTKTSLLAGLIYSLSFFPIQLSHFYAVDTILNFFIFFTLYHLVQFYQTQKFRYAIFSGIGFGLSLATKISATMLIFSIATTLTVDIFLSIVKKIHYRPLKLKNIILSFFLVTLLTAITFILFEPFAILDFSTFWRQINEQRAMTRNAFVFPYTLQYVNTIPYLYHLKNIFIWGLGPILGSLALIGGIFTLAKLFKGLLSPGNEEYEGSQLIILIFFFTYFLATGNFAVKFMRYCLPLYPIFAILISRFIFSLPKKLFLLISTIFVLHLFWLFAFLSIYRFPNTRVQATSWISQNVPPGSTILREHWDDGLPLGYTSDYNLQELALYESDNKPDKWPIINQQLDKGDYLVIASNRLYTPLQKLTDCSRLPPDRCYPITANYYRDLFSGKLAYQKVAEFTSYPQIFGIALNDQSADESFTVYDHPKVTIFKKVNQ